jgi:hypothetical protein
MGKDIGVGQGLDAGQRANAKLDHVFTTHQSTARS